MNEFGFPQIIMLVVAFWIACIFEEWFERRKTKIQPKPPKQSDPVVYPAPDPGEGRVPIPGLRYSPYLKFPRNSSCYCDSGKKYKHCCLQNEPELIPQEHLEEASRLIKKVRGK